MVQKPKGFRSKTNVWERHMRILELRAKGYLLKQIGLDVGLHHSTILYHLHGDCGCELGFVCRACGQVVAA